MPSQERLGFIRLEAEVNIPESYTKKLIASTSNQALVDTFSKQATNLIEKYFTDSDKDDLCLNDDDEAFGKKNECKNYLTRETVGTLAKVKGLLSQMASATDASTFTALHALMGKEFVKNQFVLGTLFSLDTKCEISYKLKLQGQRVSQLVKKVSANPSCR